MSRRSGCAWGLVLIVILVLASLGTCGRPAQPTIPTARPSPLSDPIPVATEPADTWTRQPPTSTPSITAVPPTPTPSVLPTTPTLTDLPTALANANANLRAGPGTNYPIVGGVKTNAPLAIVARNPAGDWLQLASGAWIFGNLVSNAPLVPVAAAIPAPPAPTTRPIAVATATAVPVPMASPMPTAGLPECVGRGAGQRYGAICNDNSRSGATGSGACSRHGGVKTWLTCP